MSAPITVDQLLADARSGLRRLTPQQAHAQMREAYGSSTSAPTLSAPATA
jgi:hypothetical protein